MSHEDLQIGGAKLPILSWTNHALSYDEQAMLRNVSRLPCVFHHVALMADGHLGKGCMVGSVIATKDAVAPATVGVDIGCGMMAIKTPFHSSQLDGKLPDIHNDILKYVPVGFAQEGKFARSDVRRSRKQEWDGFNTFNELHEGVQDRKETALRQLGTLGGGNHFIEVCLDVATEQEVWVVLHSGSRNIGKEVADRHIATAKSLWRLSELPDSELAYFIKGTDEYTKYIHDLFWCQQYAFRNREVMLDRVVEILGKHLNNGKVFRPLFQVNCHHNYVSEERHFGEDVLITRKGAIKATTEDYGIIPGSMGTHTYIVKGLGNAESFNSASHGAGRRMSRGQAKRTFTVADLELQTEGIICPKTQSVLDEIPACYKDIKDVMENQSDLVEVVQELRQVINIKG